MNWEGTSTKSRGTLVPAREGVETRVNIRCSKWLELRDLARQLKRRVAVCHVLRYTQFYRTLKKIIASGGQDVMAEACRGHGGVQVIRQIEIAFEGPGRQGE